MKTHSRGNMKTIIPLVAILFVSMTNSISAKIDLVTLPSRENIALTLYKSQSMAIVQEIRSLSLIKGINELQFSWLHTRIDPESIEMVTEKTIEGIDIKNIRFPAHMNQMAIWKISSTRAISIPMKLRYLTSGLDWRAYYAAILSHDEKTMQLKAYVRVNNHSGESFKQAKIYLMMGSVNMLEPIEKLTYGYPEKKHRKRKQGIKAIQRKKYNLTAQMDAAIAMSEPVPNAIRMDTASEYAVFEIDRREDLIDKWDRQLVLMENQSIPVTNVYRFNSEKYGNRVIRIIQFKNELKMPDKNKFMPLPGGKIRIYHDIYQHQHFSYEGQAKLDDIPIGKKVELFLGEQDQVNVEKKRMKKRTDHYQFDSEGNILSWEEIFQDRIELNNTRPVSVSIEIICRLNETSWKIEQIDKWVTYERMDQSSVKFCVVLDKHTRKGFSYNVQISHRNNSPLTSKSLIR
jgi:hypothetical protein